MNIDKNKILATAQKYVEKGQIDKAIKEYLKLIGIDQGDIRSYLRLGELYTKNGDLVQAAKVYKFVADRYTNDGFYLKAVAVYKNLIKLIPDDLEVNEKLGDLYSTLGLVGDAIAQYTQVASKLETKDALQDLSEILKKIQKIDPKNIDAGIKQATLCLRHGKKDEAKTQYKCLTE